MHVTLGLALGAMLLAHAHRRAALIRWRVQHLAEHERVVTALMPTGDRGPRAPVS
jgi:hypothetical protein